MRILALLSAVDAVIVWWAPLPKLAQCLTLVLAAISLLALRSAWNRLDQIHAAALKAKDVLREMREGNQAAQTDVLGKLDSLVLFARRDREP